MTFALLLLVGCVKNGSDSDESEAILKQENTFASTEKANTCEEDPYNAYKEYVNKIEEEFAPQGFIRISEEDVYYSASFPENDYFDEQNDLYENDPLQPKARKLAFIDDNSQTAVWITFLFSENHLEKEYVTLDSFPELNASASLGEKEQNILEIFESVLKEKHCITLLRFLPLGELNEAQDVEFAAHRNCSAAFMQEYCDILCKLDVE